MNRTQIDLANPPRHSSIVPSFIAGQSFAKSAVLVMCFVLVLVSQETRGDQRRVFAVGRGPNLVSLALEFEEQAGTFRDLNLGTSSLYPAVTNTGSSLLILERSSGLPQRQRIAEYSLDGTYLGDFVDLEPTLAPANSIETDRIGNVYLRNVGDVRRYDADGQLSLSIPTPNPGNGGIGIDADRSGNIFVSVTTGFRKYSSNGTLLESIATPLGFLGDLSVDEVGELLYVGAQQGGVAVYDISGAQANLLRTFPTPPSVGLTYDEATGNLLLASQEASLQEYTPEGLLVGNYIYPAWFFDVTTVLVPEPGTGFGLALLLPALFRWPRVTRVQ